MFNANPAGGLRKISAKIFIKGVVTNKAALPKNADKNDLYITSEEGEAFFYDGKNWKSAGGFAVAGPPGKDGVDGLPGKDGATGLKGETGPAGLVGPQGEPGPRGPTGLPGLAGKDGTAGVEGKPGKDGRDGRDGKDGMAGPTGERGPIGSKGDVGPAGPKGDQGPKGEKGDSSVVYPEAGVVVSTGTEWDDSIPLSDFIKVADEQKLINKTLEDVRCGTHTVAFGVVDASLAYLQTLVLNNSEVVSLVNFKEGSMVRLTIANRHGCAITWPKVHWVSGTAPRLSALTVIDIWKANGQIIGAKL